jgi:LysM repeat protein
MKKTAIICCLSALLLTVVVAGCTRAKPEAPTPTLALDGTATPEVTSTAAAAAVVPTATGTTVYTPEARPTSVPLTSEPTVISVAEASPTPLPPVVLPTATVPAGQSEHTVQWGDTLFSLARRYGTTVEAIVALNGLADASNIRVGQVLRIPGTAAPVPGSGEEYVVQPGDTLFSIARRFGTTVDAIQRANGIVNPTYISVGQRLVIPEGSTPPPTGGTTYTVQAGDTLYSIAAKYGKNVWDIVVANNLSEPYWILVGQVLTIPQ